MSVSPTYETWDEWDPDPDGEYRDEVVHPTWVEGCADCVDRADRLEQERTR